MRLAQARRRELPGEPQRDHTRSRRHARSRQLHARGAAGARARRHHGALRAERLGQDHVAARDRGARGPGSRHGIVRRSAVAKRGPACPAAPARHRLRVPGRPPVSASHRGGQPALRAAPRGESLERSATDRFRDRRPRARPRVAARASSQLPLGRRAAARRDRARAAHEPAAVVDGRAAVLARPRAQARDRPAHRAAARDVRRAGHLRDAQRRRGRATRGRHAAAQRGYNRRRRTGRRGAR